MQGGEVAAAESGNGRGTARESVVLGVPDFRTFLRRFSSSISRDGIFLETPEPQRPGTRLDFELRLPDGDPLIRGRGEVAWASDADEDGAGGGMGIRFLNLDAKSRRLIGITWQAMLW